MLTYDLSKGDGSLYNRLYQCIKNDIVSAALLPDEKLPSRRALSENLGISTVTVDNAYALLLEEGYIYALPKKDIMSRVCLTHICACHLKKI